MVVIHTAGVHIKILKIWHAGDNLPYKLSVVRYSDVAQIHFFIGKRKRLSVERKSIQKFDIRFCKLQGTDIIPCQPGEVLTPQFNGVQ